MSQLLIFNSVCSTLYRYAVHYVYFEFIETVTLTPNIYRNADCRPPEKCVNKSNYVSNHHVIIWVLGLGNFKSCPSSVMFVTEKYIMYSSNILFNKPLIHIPGFSVINKTAGKEFWCKIHSFNWIIIHSLRWWAVRSSLETKHLSQLTNIQF